MSNEPACNTNFHTLFDKKSGLSSPGQGSHPIYITRFLDIFLIALGAHS
jgi:hypothetical protein